MIETIMPTDKNAWLALRAKDITSTESPALFGASPYATEFELWHRKRNAEVVALNENERMKWGNRLQDAIAYGIAQDEGWVIRKMDEYMRDSDLRMGASFDFAIGEAGILEVKNVDSLAFRDGWIVGGENIEAPPHIEIQIQHQLAVSGRRLSYIGALVGGNRIVLLRREPDQVIITRIKSRILSFWKSIEEGIEPKPDFSRDAGFIAKLYGYSEVGKILDATNEIESLAEEYKALSNAAKTANNGKEEAKAQILMLIGDAEKVKGAKFSISAGMIGPTHVEYDREGYRSFRINWKKEEL